MLTTDRLAVAALRGVLQELEGDPAGARAALVALLAPPPPAPVVHRDLNLNPENITKRPAARRRATRSARPAPAAPEAMQLVAALVARYGSSRAGAAAAGVSEKMMSRWRTGRAQPSEASLARVREALEAPEDEGEPARAPEVERTQAQALVAELVERFGDLEAAAASCGLGLAHLRSWESGGPCSPRALGRLREAAHAPVGRSDPRVRSRREATPAAAPDEAAAGEGDASAEADEAA